MNSSRSPELRVIIKTHAYKPTHRLTGMNMLCVDGIVDQLCRPSVDEEVIEVIDCATTIVWFEYRTTCGRVKVDGTTTINLIVVLISKSDTRDIYCRSLCKCSCNTRGCELGVAPNFDHVIMLPLSILLLLLELQQ